MMGALDLSDPNDYARFLAAQAAALLPLEATLDHAGAAAIFPQWPAHRRGPALAADLDALGIALPSPALVPQLVGEPDVLGALYVIEGSRLGGKMLRRTVPNEMPTAFLDHAPALDWREFVAYLEQMLASQVDRAVAIRAANATFDAFTGAARQVLENE